MKFLKIHVLQVLGLRLYYKWTPLQVFFKYFAKNLFNIYLKTSILKEHLSVTDSVYLRCLEVD